MSKTGRRLTADGTLLKGLAKRRICVPPLVTGGAYNQFGYDLFTGDAESAYLHFAANNLTAPEDAARAMPRLELAQNLHRGAELPWQARFERLSDLFEDIGAATGLGLGHPPGLRGEAVRAGRVGGGGPHDGHGPVRAVAGAGQTRGK